MGEAGASSEMLECSLVREADRLADGLRLPFARIRRLLRVSASGVTNSVVLSAAISASSTPAFNLSLDVSDAGRDRPQIHSTIDLGVGVWFGLSM